MNKDLPPRWIRVFFHWFCKEELVEAVEGDLLALYSQKRKCMSSLRANTWYFINVLTFIQPFALKKRQTNHSNPIEMFYNYVRTGIRFMKKHAMYSAINVIGLAIGLSAVMLMTLFILDELSYDRFHSKGHDIKRITYKLETPNSIQKGAKMPFPMKSELKNYPEVAKVARLYHWGGDTPLLAFKENKHTEEGVFFGEPDLFDVFDFQFVKGDPATALADT